MGGKYNPEAYKKYYEENKDIISERSKQRRLNNLEEVREKERKRDRAEYKKEYREINKEILKEKRRLYRQNNKDRINKYQNERYKKSREGVKKIKAPGAYNITLAERNKEAWLKEELYFYHLKLIDDDGTIFYKYGLTKNVKSRLWKIPYKIEILETILLNKYDAIWKEYNSLKEVNRYTPQRMFGGYTECFN